MSDLHLEFGDMALPGGDILLLAGDIWLAAPMQGEALNPNHQRLRDRFRRFCVDELSKYKRVFLVNGNHEHYGLHWKQTADIVRQFLVENAPHAILLDTDVHVEFGFAWLGSTLWASYGYPDPMQMFVIKERMRDCMSIRTTAKEGWTTCLTPTDIQKEHQVARYRLAYLTKTHAHLPKVLITHHAPSWMSKKFSAYPAGDADWAYYSNFERIFAVKNRIKLAIHGHTHENCRYLCKGTVVVSNQRGYAGYDLGADSFDPHLCDVHLSELLQNETNVDPKVKPKRKSRCVEKNSL